MLPEVDVLPLLWKLSWGKALELPPRIEEISDEPREFEVTPPRELLLKREERYWL